MPLQMVEADFLKINPNIILFFTDSAPIFASLFGWDTKINSFKIGLDL